MEGMRGADALEREKGQEAAGALERRRMRGGGKGSGSQTWLPKDRGREKGKDQGGVRGVSMAICRQLRQI